MNDIINVSMSRRQFLGLGAAGAGVFVLGMTLPAGGRLARAAGSELQAGELNAFIGIKTDGGVIFQNPFIEMGQGTYTAIPAIMADELDVAMHSITVEQAPHGPEYRIMFGNTQRFTGGSFSVRSSYQTMRKAGATARAMLVRAAADEWGVSPSDCDTTPGYVVHKPSGKQLGYGELADKAAGLEPPEKVALKDSDDFRLIGKPVKRTDSLAKVTGRAEFGIDVQVDGMVHAAVKQSPVFGGRVKSFDAAAVADMPGVIAVDEIPNGVAVLAEQFWQAKKALDKLPVAFDNAGHEDFSDRAYLEKLRSRLDDKDGSAEDVGDVDKALKAADRRLEADYHAPFLAHATMEPMNCTARVDKDHCTVWAPNQGADYVAGTAAEITGLPEDKITVETPFLGGGFGRRFIMDFTAQAVTLAKKHQGTPVKVIWTREEDTRHDFYRPMTAARYRAGFDAEGRVTALHITAVGDGPIRRHMESSIGEDNIDPSVVEGSIHQPYAIAHRRTDVVYEPNPAPIGFWRSVGNSHNAFFKESFIDELAHARKADPVAFRRALLEDQPRFKKVLDTVVDMADWQGKPWRADDDTQHAMGVALHESFNTIVGEIAEVSVAGGRVKVHRVWCTVDCGFAVNPAIVTAQMESGIAFGLSAALAEKVTIENGRAQQANFDTYPILTPDQMPDIRVEIVNSGADLGGIGEPGTPPIAPAVCNALYALTGKRIRSLPLQAHDFTAGA
jgi:isoquinoline 1-oxidoreductase beta subunit